MGLKILSLFDGMSCGMLALLGVGQTVDRYVAYEIDKYAIQTSKHNFPMIEQMGDVFEADFTEYKGFDGIVGGSPCTYWSIAQKNNRQTEASGLGWELFSQYVRAVREAKPKWFIYENNKSMSKQIRASITETFGFEPICINSALVSAQNRQRLYWVGVRDEFGIYHKVNVEQPEDRGILLKDILEDGFADKEKAYCLKHQAGNARDYFKKHHTTVKFEPVGITKDGKSFAMTSNYKNGGGSNYAAHTLEKHTKSMAAEPVNITDEGKSQTIKAQYQQTSPANILGYNSTYGASGVAEPCCMRYERSDEAKAVRKQYESGEVHHGFREMSELHPREDGKTNTLSTVSKDNPIAEPVCVGAVPENNGTYLNGKQPSQQYRVYDPEGKAVAVTTTAITNVPEPVCVSERGRYEDTGNRNVKGNGKIEQFYEVREGGKTNALTTVQKDNSVAEPIRVGCYPSPDGTLKNSQGMRIYSIDGKSVNQTAQGGGMGAKTGLYAVPVEDSAIYQFPHGYNSGGIKYQKAPTLTSNGDYQDNNKPFERVFTYATPCEWDENGIPTKAISCADGKTYTVYKVEDGKITIKGKTYPIKLVDGYWIIRKLTVRECMRLQTVPEWFEFPVSDSQAYKQLGNGWTVQVICHLLKAIFDIEGECK